MNDGQEWLVICEKHQNETQRDKGTKRSIKKQEQVKIQKKFKTTAFMPIKGWDYTHEKRIGVGKNIKNG